MKRPCPYHLVAGIRVLCEVFSVLVKVGTIYGVHQGVLKSDCFAEPSQLLPAIMQSIIMSFISENRPTWLKFQSVGTRTCRTVWAMPPSHAGPAMEHSPLVCRQSDPVTKLQNLYFKKKPCENIQKTSKMSIR